MDGELIMTTKEIEKYILDLKKDAMIKGEKNITIVAQDIADNLNIEKRFPMICHAMYNCMTTDDEVIYAPPSGLSNKVEIKYYL